MNGWADPHRDRVAPLSCPLLVIFRNLKNRRQAAGATKGARGRIGASREIGQYPRVAALAPTRVVASYSARCARVPSPARYRQGKTSESPKQSSRQTFLRTFHFSGGRLALRPAKPRAAAAGPRHHAIARSGPIFFRTSARLYADAWPGSAGHRLCARAARTLFSRRRLWTPPARARAAASRRSRLSGLGREMDRQRLWADRGFCAALAADARCPELAHCDLGTPPGGAVS